MLGEVGILDAVENLRPIKIEKTIILPREDYKNFITDMTVERQFLKENSSLCKIDDKGIWHCLLVVLKGHQEGVLVMADQEGFLSHAARLWSTIHIPVLLQRSRSNYSYQ